MGKAEIKEIIRAKVLGFCMGVQRAVELALDEAERSGGQGVYTLGPLIHNPAVLADLKKKGIQIIDEQPKNPWDRLDEKPFVPNSNSSVIIRAHGISPDVEKELRGNGCHIIDATCPRVKASQLKAEELSLKGYSLFLAGEVNHAEIEGIMGYAGTSSCAVVSCAEEAGKSAAKLYGADKSAKTALLGQTTISEDEYQKIAEAIKKYFPNLEVEMSICDAAAKRRQALRELLDEVDAVIIAGGKESANTRRLLAIAEESGKPCALVEDVREIPAPFRFFEKVGISAGASTPDSLIEEIEMEFLR